MAPYQYEVRLSTTRAFKDIHTGFFSFGNNFLHIFPHFASVRVRSPSEKYEISHSRWRSLWTPTPRGAIEEIDFLIEDFHRKKQLQILFLPISLLKSFVRRNYRLDVLFSYDSSNRCLRFINSLCPLFGHLSPLKNHDTSYRITNVRLCHARIHFWMGFVFLILTIASTLAGGILGLIQVLLLIKDIYQYLKNKRANQKRVQPITLPDAQSPAISLTPTIETRGKQIWNK